MVCTKGRSHRAPSLAWDSAPVGARERIGQAHLAVPLGDVAAMQQPDLAKVRLQRRNEVLGQHGHPILAALRIASRAARCAG